jgi:hypothetical protein
VDISVNKLVSHALSGSIPKVSIPSFLPHKKPPDAEYCLINHVSHRILLLKCFFYMIERIFLPEVRTEDINSGKKAYSLLIYSQNQPVIFIGYFLTRYRVRLHFKSILVIPVSHLAVIIGIP